MDEKGPESWRSELKRPLPPPVVTPVGAAKRDFYRDLHSFDRAAMCRLAGLVGGWLLSLGLICVALICWLRTDPISNYEIAGPFIGSLMLIYFLPGISLFVAGKIARRGGKETPIIILVVGLWELGALATVVIGRFKYGSLFQNYFDATGELDVVQTSMLMVVIADVLIGLLLLRCMYHCTLLLLFKGKQFAMGATVRLTDLLFLSSRPTIPGDSSGTALLGKVRVGEGLLLFVLGTLCFVCSIDWVEIPAGKVGQSTSATRNLPFQGDVYSSGGLPAGERKAAIDAICDAGMDPKSQPALDEALRWDGRKIFAGVQSTLTFQNVAAIVTVVSHDSRNGGFVIEVPGPFRISYLVVIGGGQISVDNLNHASPNSRISYSSGNPTNLALRKLNETLDQLNQAHPGMITQLQADTLMKFITESRNPQSATTQDGIPIARCELLGDGTLKVRQEEFWQWVSSNGSFSSYSPDEQASIDLQSEREALEKGKVDVSRWAGLLLAMTGLFGLLNGTTTLGLAIWSAPGERLLAPKTYIFNTFLMGAGMVYALGNWIARTGLEFELVASTIILVSAGVVWMYWSVTVGVAGPLRLAQMNLNGKPDLPPTTRKKGDARR